jgi:hypothetical protein
MCKRLRNYLNVRFGYYYQTRLFFLLTIENLLLVRVLQKMLPRSVENSLLIPYPVTYAYEISDSRQCVCVGGGKGGWGSN